MSSKLNGRNNIKCVRKIQSSHTISDSKLMPLLLCDFYKTVHAEQYNSRLTKMTSYFTPRMSRVDGTSELIMFGLQSFLKEYFVQYFNEHFFKRPLKEVLHEYNRILSHSLSPGVYSDTKIVELHKLGYLPLEVIALPEGTRVPVKVPMLGISNTHPEFVWLVNSLETLISCSLWHAMISANVGYVYRLLIDKVYAETVEDDVPRKRALGDFSMRGQESLESAVKSSAAFCLSFVNTASVPAIDYLERYYNCDCTKDEVAYGSVSTEHSVMCSNFAIDGDEITMVKRLLTETYPNNNFSMVSDSYDYWNLVEYILPKCKKEIMEHNGTIYIRGDSGDPVDIICGVEPQSFNSMQDFEYFKMSRGLCLRGYVKVTEAGKTHYFKHAGKSLRDNWTEIEEPVEVKGTVQCLWEKIGGTINSKGYKVLDWHVRAIYGDSITPQRAAAIYARLKAKGFAANNVVLGVGSFSMQCMIGEHNELIPFTRDTFGIAIKATYAEINETKVVIERDWALSTEEYKKVVDEACANLSVDPILIFKNPKTDTGNFKKSQKGLCYVYKDKETGTITYEDEHSCANPCPDDNLLEVVFRNGKMVKEYTLNEVRHRLHPNF